MTIETIIQITLNGLSNGIIYALPALGLSLVWNASGLLNFAQGDLLTFGGYIMFTLFHLNGVPYIVAFVLTLIVMGLVGYFLSWIYFYPMFREKVNPYIILIGTVALSVFIKNLILVIWGSTPVSYANAFGTLPIVIGELYIMPHIIGNIGIMILLVVLLQYFLRVTPTGTAMRAVAQNQTASWLMGIRNDRMIALTFMLSTAIAAVSGILIVPITTMSPTMGGTMGVKVLASVLIGGLGSFSGALVGGILVGLSEIYFSMLCDPAYRDVFIFGLLVLFLIFRPGGIFKVNISEKV